ncbi:hypothetical protein NFI96_029692 [Prochilodus magdalenae]|nr:hypothetical protein NFI96_029692 [Prochilodus magdalenae]
MCVCMCTDVLYSFLFSSVQHTDIAVNLCSDTDGEKIFGLDGEEMWHADFTQGKGEMTMPQFADPSSYVEGTYEGAVTNQAICKQNLKIAIGSHKNPPEPKNAPQTSVYSKADVQLGSQNTLICYITGFYPPQVTVSWTRNNVKVSDQVSLSRYYPTSDGTFNLISHLSFTPEQGDIYTCTVEHTALDRPLTKTWDVQVALPGVGPSVFCGVGLAAGLLGVAVGTFFLVKGNNYGYYMYSTNECITSAADLKDVEFIYTKYFNKDPYARFNSTVGKFVGYTKYGVHNAEIWNNDPAILQKWRGELDRYCKPNLQIDFSTVLSKSVKPTVKLTLEQQSSGDHPALLMCSAYDFYPRAIEVSWLVDDKKVTSDVVSTEEMADGDWYYQIHSHLEHKPKSGEKISCVVDHVSSDQPIILNWDGSGNESEKNKIAIGASGLVLGIILSAAGFIYYKKKSSGQWRHQRASDTDCVNVLMKYIKTFIHVCLQGGYWYRVKCCVLWCIILWCIILWASVLWTASRGQCPVGQRHVGSILCPASCAH